MERHQCELELIAETATSTEMQDSYVDQTSTAYLACAECGKVYAETTESRTYEGYDTPGAQMITRREYKGSLSKEELARHAKKHLGTITEQDERNIIRLRN